MSTPEQKEHRRQEVVEALKLFFWSKHSLFFYPVTLMVIYLETINFHWWNIVMYPLIAVLGWRLGYYGILGCIPGGVWLYNHRIYTIRFAPVLKTWSHRFKFLRKNCFTVEFHHLSKEMVKGYTASSREVTGPIAVTVGLGLNKYVFALD